MTLLAFESTLFGFAHLWDEPADLDKLSWPALILLAHRFLALIWIAFIQLIDH